MVSDERQARPVPGMLMSSSSNQWISLFQGSTSALFYSPALCCSLWPACLTRSNILIAAALWSNHWNAANERIIETLFPFIHKALLSRSDFISLRKSTIVEHIHSLLWG